MFLKLLKLVSFYLSFGIKKGLSGVIFGGGCSVLEMSD